jgi:hypothetical protein
MRLIMLQGLPLSNEFLKLVNAVLLSLHLLCWLFLRGFLDYFRLCCYRLLKRSCYDAYV